MDSQMRSLVLVLQARECAPDSTTSRVSKRVLSGVRPGLITAGAALFPIVWPHSIRMCPHGPSVGSTPVGALSVSLWYFRGELLIDGTLPSLRI